MNFLLDIAEAHRSGVFIEGTSGTGKTNQGMNIGRELMSRGTILFVIDPTQAWRRKFYPIGVCLAIHSLQHKQTVNWNDISTIFDTSILTPMEQQKFIEAFCAQIMHVAINRSEQSRPNIIIVFEEAHTPIYNGCMRSKKAQQTARLLTQGRNFKIRFIAITQFASMVDKLPVKMAQQRYFFRTSEKNDMAYVEEFVGSKVDMLPDLKIGECLYDFGNITKRIQTPLFEGRPIIKEAQK